MPEIAKFRCKITIFSPFHQPVAQVFSHPHGKLRGEGLVTGLKSLMRALPLSTVSYLLRYARAITAELNISTAYSWHTRGGIVLPWETSAAIASADVER